MSLGGGYKAPAPAQTAQPATPAPTVQEADVQISDEERRRRAAVRRASTVLTGDDGLDGQLGHSAPGAKLKGTMG